MTTKMMPIGRLKKMRSAELGKLLADLVEDDLTKAGDWDGSFDDLRESIRRHGIIKPLDVYQFESGERLLGNGHHRAFLAIQLGLDAVPYRVEKVGARG